MLSYSADDPMGHEEALPPPDGQTDLFCPEINSLRIWFLRRRRQERERGREGVDGGLPLNVGNLRETTRATGTESGELFLISSLSSSSSPRTESGTSLFPRINSDRFPLVLPTSFYPGRSGQRTAAVVVAEVTEHLAAVDCGICCLPPSSVPPSLPPNSQYPSH